MKRTSYIGMVVAVGTVALGVLGAPGDGIAADATKPTYNNYRPQHGNYRPQQGNTRPQPSGPNDNDHHANYHADYSAGQDGRPAQPKSADEKADPREDSRRFQDGDRAIGSRRFQDGDRAIRSPYGWRR